jgi:hypothetical protein
MGETFDAKVTVLRSLVDQEIVGVRIERLPDQP